MKSQRQTTVRGVFGSKGQLALPPARRFAILSCVGAPQYGRPIRGAVPNDASGRTAGPVAADKPRRAASTNALVDEVVERSPPACRRLAREA